MLGEDGSSGAVGASVGRLGTLDGASFGELVKGSSFGASLGCCEGDWFAESLDIGGDEGAERSF